MKGPDAILSPETMDRRRRAGCWRTACEHERDEGG